MNFPKTVLFLLILPLTLTLDLVLFAFMQTCPTCGSFSQFLAKETAFSFPIIAGLTTWAAYLTTKFKMQNSKFKITDKNSKH